MLGNFSTISSVQSFIHVQLFVTQWTAAHQASLSITNSQSLLKLNYYLFKHSLIPFLLVFFVHWVNLLYFIFVGLFDFAYGCICSVYIILIIICLIL